MIYQVILNLSGRSAWFNAISREQVSKWLTVHNWKWLKIHDPNIEIPEYAMSKLRDISEWH